MADSTNLRLPYIAAAQAQKHITHNEAIRALDCVVQLAVIDRDLAAPPLTPLEGVRYLVAAAATGVWTGHSNKIAAFQDGAWAIYAPVEGWLAWINDEDILVTWTGTAWVNAISAAGLATLSKLGINTTADTTNRLSVSAPACLFSHEGAGHQLKINKAAATDTASILLQTGFSGRAELGLAGDDNCHFKVSPDGVTWKDAIIIDKTSGAVAMPFSGAAGRTAVTFGTGADSASVAITGQAAIQPSSIVTAFISPLATADHSIDEHLVEDIAAAAHSIVAGSGFTITATTRNKPLTGQWTVAWNWR